MKFIKQFGIVLLVIFVGEILHYTLPLPIPASIYGLILLLLALITGIIRLEWIEETADWLVGIMPICFVPASIGLIDEWEVLRPFLVPLVVMCAVSTVLIFGVSGSVTQAIIRRRKAKEEKQHD